MDKKTKNYLFNSITFFTAFILLIVLLNLVDKDAIGPKESIVGLSTLNNFYHNLVNVNFKLYTVTDFGGIPPFIYLLVFGFMGLIQLIKRRSLLKVDKDILALGVFFLLTFLIYLFFEFVVINYRPVLINDKLESSFPSSTTFLSIALLISGSLEIDNYIKNKKVTLVIKIISISYCVFLVVGRLISGVHWLTDIIGAILISVSLIYLFLFLRNLFNKIIKD